MDGASVRLKVLVSFEDRLRPDSTGVYIVNAFRQLGHIVTHVLPENIQTVTGGHDLYIKVDDGICSYWNENLHPSAYYVIDTHIETDWRLDIANKGKFDFLSVTHKTGLSLPWPIQPLWLPVGCDPDYHHVGPREKKYDVCFIGNFHSQYASRRLDMVDRLFKTSNNFFFGNRTFKDMAEKFAESKIVFNCSLNGDVNMRFFEALCSGSCLVTDRLPEIAELGFIDKSHYFGYDTADEMADIVNTLLTQDSYRERVASKGKQEVMSRHTYADRAKEIISRMEKKELCLR